jgi:hypothetical protein
MRRSLPGRHFKTFKSSVVLWRVSVNRSELHPMHSRTCAIEAGKAACRILNRLDLRVGVADALVSACAVKMFRRAGRTK